MAYILTYVPDDHCDGCIFKKPGEVICNRFDEFLDNDLGYYKRCERCKIASEKVNELLKMDRNGGNL